MVSFIQLVKNDFEEVPLNAASMASSGTHLSPFLRFGCLSPRVMWQRLTETYGKVGCSLGCYLCITDRNRYSKIPRLRIKLKFAGEPLQKDLFSLKFETGSCFVKSIKKIM